MKPFIALFVLATGFLISPVAGQENCPRVNLHGPAGLVRPGDTFVYRVTVEPIESDWRLKYVWSVSSGKIEAGQGTSEILIRNDTRGQTVTVEVAGFPNPACAVTVSESSSGGLPPPQPVKIGIWNAGQPLTVHHRFAEELDHSPDNQGFIFLIRSPGSTQNSLAEVKNAVINKATKDQNSDPSRVTIVEAEGFEEAAEFWRVPPGADNPKCESCKPAECPTITVTGPAGIWLPEESITFVASVAPSELKNLTFHWTIEGGDLIDGQGKSQIKVKTRKTLDPRITAAVRVTGLPAGCPATASELSSYVIDHTYILLDELSISPKEISRSSLDKLAKRLTDYPADYGYIIEYFPPRTPKAVVQRKIGSIRSHLLTRGQAENEYKIVIAQADRPLTKVFAIPPGAESPVP